MRPAPHDAPEGFVWITRLESWSLQETLLTVTAATSTGDRAGLTFEAARPRTCGDGKYSQPALLTHPSPGWLLSAR